ncbi:helix-turn-helix transcriptional regulator [Polynucleobacter sp. 73C-SIWE]|uniref:helix-turn-helix domain-containing protein n=1 Tax=Polynucleobacter sp. 73C-SIWE TaxID=2689098 RepID=UPI001C0B47B3|nr:helix-turn-helix transcriptional regulator [Polynucleobacter sp. 73C-SIWE]MBU3580363.1 helix-turn-helix transcriptional regulator [Polynucleobacter sp. 73C-SIWE]
MNKSVKLPEIRKEAFTRAREALGLSTKELSGMACLSVRQIEQIENGETSSFYGSQIKVTAAKKVAGLLKLKEEDAFDFGEQAPPEKTIVEKPVEPVVTNKVATVEKESVLDKKSKPQQVEETPKVVIKDPKPLTQFEGSKASTQSNPKKKLFVLLGIATALVFSIVNLRPLFFPEPPKEEIVVEVLQEAPPANAPVEEAKQATAPAITSAPELAATAAVSTDCPAADSATVTYKPDAPKKAGDMVYFQSKASQTVCVTDASGKTQNKTLEPGVGASIYGKPPFKVLTLGLNQVDLYFQGAKVRTGGAGKTIILEAAEISQPAASDSQMR